MRPSKRILITMMVIGIAVLFGLLVTVFLRYRSLSENPAQIVEAIPEGADIAIDDIRHTAVKDGRKQWSLIAASAQYSDEAKEALFSDIQVTFFLENNREVMVKGHQGRLEIQTNDIEITGDVVATDADYQLKAEVVAYDHDHRTVIIPVPVKINGPSFELQAEKMTVDLVTETARLQGTVKGLFREDDINID